MKTKTVIENGFKETEIGLIPEDWNIGVIGKTIEVIRGVSWKKDEVTDSGITILTIPNIQDGKITYDTDIRLNKTINEEKLLRYGDTIAVASSGSVKNIGRSAFFDEKYCEKLSVASFLLILRPNKGVQDYFLYYLSKSELLKLSNFGRRAADGKFNFQVNEFKKSFLPLPPLPEQQKIASVLSKIQQAIEQQDKIIQTTKELKKSMMNKLFREGLHGEEEKETEIGLIPKSWEIVSISEVVEKTGQIDPRKKANFTFKYIDVSGISNEYFRIIDYKTYNNSNAPSRARKQILTDDVIFATVRPTLKRIAYIDNSYDGEICSTAFCVLRSKKDILLSKYIYYYIQKDEFIEELAKLQRGASYPAVTDTDVKSQKIPLPHIEEQKEIATILSSIDKKIQQSEARKQTLQALFKTMLNQLMTGKTRVKDLDIEVKENVRA